MWTLTHYRLNKLISPPPQPPPSIPHHHTHYILEESNFNFRYVGLRDLDIPRKKWLNYLQAVETNQTSHSEVFDLGLPCLPVLGFSRLKWVKATEYTCWFVSVIFDKGDNICDFLFPFLHTKSLLERGLL